jgi:hypothetical protein
LLVAVNSSKKEDELLDSRKASRPRMEQLTPAAAAASTTTASIVLRG